MAVHLMSFEFGLCVCLSLALCVCEGLSLNCGKDSLTELVSYGKIHFRKTKNCD